MSLCKVGIESYANTFHHYLCENSQLVSTKYSVDLLNPNWIAYNETLAAAAETCKKVCAFSTDYLSCVKETFCNTATDAVKKIGNQVYLINLESNQASAVAAFPWAVGITVAGVAVVSLTKAYAPKGRLSDGLWVAGNVIGVLGAITLWQCGRSYFNIFT